MAKFNSESIFLLQGISMMRLMSYYLEVVEVISAWELRPVLWIFSLYCSWNHIQKFLQLYWILFFLKTAQCNFRWTMNRTRVSDSINNRYSITQVMRTSRLSDNWKLSYLYSWLNASQIKLIRHQNLQTVLTHFRWIAECQLIKICNTTGANKKTLADKWKGKFIGLIYSKKYLHTGSCYFPIV